MTPNIDDESAGLGKHKQQRWWLGKSDIHEDVLRLELIIATREA